MLPYQVVPPSGEKKTHTSIAFAVVVLAKDAAPPGHLKVPPAQDTVLLGVASFAKINVKDVARFELLLEPAKVNVQFPVNVAVNTCPLVAVIV